MKLTETEPVVTGITPAVVASVVLGGLSVFEIWTPNELQYQWINGALLPLLMAVGAWFARHHAWAPATVERLVVQERQAAVVEAEKVRAEPVSQPPPERAMTRVAPPLPVQPPIVAAIYSARLGRWTTVYLRPAPVGGGQFVLTPTAQNGLPVAERRPGGPFTTIGPEEQSRMGLRLMVRHPDEDGN